MGKISYCYFYTNDCKSTDCTCANCPKQQDPVFARCANCEAFPYRFLTQLKIKNIFANGEKEKLEKQENARVAECENCLIRQHPKVNNINKIPVLIREDWMDSQPNYKQGYQR